MSNDTMVTLQGYVGGDVRLRPAAGTFVAGFRVACTPRRFQRSSAEWVDGTTQWYTVNAWRALAEHCDRSLRRGDPVIVHGRLQQRSYVNKSGLEVTTLEIDAVLVGHDLNRGVTQFRKMPPPAAAGETGAAGPGEPEGQQMGPQVGQEVGQEGQQQEATTAA